MSTAMRRAGDSISAITDSLGEISLGEEDAMGVMRPEASAAPPRERILEAAARLFYERGIRDVGVDEIVQSAGVAKMSLYKHFGSKDGVLVEVLRRQHERLYARLRTAAEQRAKDPLGRLLAVFDALEEVYGSTGVGPATAGRGAAGQFRGCPFINAAAELADPAHAARAVCADHKHAIRGYLALQAEAAGLPEPQRVADQLALLLDGAVVRMVMTRSDEPVRAARAAAERVLARR